MYLIALSAGSHVNQAHTDYLRDFRRKHILKNHNYCNLLYRCLTLSAHFENCVYYLLHSTVTSSKWLQLYTADDGHLPMQLERHDCVDVHGTNVSQIG